MNEQNIPIDIAIRKLLDWLVSRRICGRDWHDSALKIREKIGGAMQDMPENEAMRQLLHGTHINYFHCLKIIEILKETEAESKNFFGQYGSKRMKDWKEIVSEYESGNVYLAEAAQLLIQNSAYEIPGLKKQIVKCEQTQTECDKKEENGQKRILELEQEYRKQCQQLGIKGEKVKREIIELAKNLPETYDRIVDPASGIMTALKDACDLYESFVRSIRDNPADEGLEIRVVENLRFLLEHGNVTTYQWKYGENPISVETPEIVFNEDDEKDDQGDDDGGIDFGDDDAVDEIDFGGDDIDFGGDGGEIDFGDEEAIDFGDGGGEIDFDVDTSAIVVEEGGMAGGVAKEEEALSLLDNRRTRTLILDELEEVAGFLSQRLVEVDSESSRLQFSLSSSSTISHDPQTVRSYLNSVENFISQLTEVKMQQLQLIRGSPAYADRLADVLKQKLKLTEKVKSTIVELQQKKELACMEMGNCEDQVKTLTQRTKELREQVESDISKRYKGRPVHITGAS